MQISVGAADGLDQSLVGDPDYGRTTIARIIASGDSTSNIISRGKDAERSKRMRYLVKWQGLPYDEASWEWEEDLKAFAAADFDKAVADLNARGPIADEGAINKAKVLLSSL